MALPEFLSGIGPFQTVTTQAYRLGSAGKLSDTDMDVTITTVGGLDYFRWTGAADLTTQEVTQDRSEIAIDKTYQWGCIESQRMQGTFAAVGDEVDLLWIGEVRFILVCSTDTSHYKVRLRRVSLNTLIGTGSTEYAVSTTFRAIRFELDGTNCILHVDGTEEFNVSYSTSKLDSAKIRLRRVSNMQAGQTFEVHNIQITQSNSRDDRPDHQAMGGGQLTLTGDKVSATFGSESNCADASGTYTKWNDWESVDAADNATANNCGEAGANGVEISDLSNPTVTNLIGIAAWSRDVSNTSSKTVDTWIRMEDTAGNFRERRQANLGTTSWENHGYAGFGRGPNITGWTSAVLNDSGLGYRTVDTNGANDDHTAILVEYFECGTDPTAAAADRRRLLAA